MPQWAAVAGRVAVLVAAFQSATGVVAWAQTVRGTLRDRQSDEAVPQGRIALLRPDGAEVTATVSDSTGAFALTAQQPGEYYLSAQRLGYQPITDGPLGLTAREDVEIAFYITPLAVLMDTVAVTTPPRIRYLDRVGFYQRKAQGLGRFLERADLEPRMPTARSWVDLLRSVPGVSIVETGRVGEGARVRISTGMISFARECAPQVFLDGLLLTFGSAPDWRALSEAIGPHDVEAIELYRRSAELPPAFGGAMSGGGVILVWSRRGP